MPKRLTARDKQEIIVLYKNTDETTSTLASKYGMASSSISRLLKKSLSTEEYERLVQEKRLARKKNKDSNSQVVNDLAETVISFKVSELLPDDEETNQPIEPMSSSFEEDDAKLITEKYQEIENRNVITLEEMLGKEMADLYQDDEEDYSEEEEEDSNVSKDLKKPILKERTKIEILPLNTASLPKYCYVVVNRWSELISRPLKDFSDLGDVPADESQEPTMPVFNNHRVAKRFSVNSQRIVKIPNSNMLVTTSHYLIAKGITRILLDGQVFALT